MQNLLERIETINKQYIISVQNKDGINVAKFSFKDMPEQNFADLCKVFNDNTASYLFNHIKTLREKFRNTYPDENPDLSVIVPEIISEILTTYNAAWNSDVFLLAAMLSYITDTHIFVISEDDTFMSVIILRYPHGKVFYVLNLHHLIFEAVTKYNASTNPKLNITGTMVGINALTRVSSALHLYTADLSFKFLHKAINDVIEYAYSNSPVGSLVLPKLLRATTLSEVYKTIEAFLNSYDFPSNHYDAKRGLLDISIAVLLSKYYLIYYTIEQILHVDSFNVNFINITQLFKKGEINPNILNIHMMLANLLQEEYNIVIPPVHISRDSYATIADFVVNMKEVYKHKLSEHAVVFLSDVLTDRKLTHDYILQYVLIDNRVENTPGSNAITTLYNTLASKYNIVKIITLEEFRLITSALNNLYIVRVIRRLLSDGVFTKSKEVEHAYSTKSLLPVLDSDSTKYIYDISLTLAQSSKYPAVTWAISQIIAAAIEFSISSAANIEDKFLDSETKRFYKLLTNNNLRDYLGGTVKCYTGDIRSLILNATKSLLYGNIDEYKFRADLHSPDYSIYFSLYKVPTVSLYTNTFSNVYTSKTYYIKHLRVLNKA